MPPPQLITLTALAMLAFAGNSLLCRIALANHAMDAASFTTLRLASGALVLWLLVRGRDGAGVRAGNWGSALALFAYAAGFSLAYLELTAATGALLLFGAVQVTMIGFALMRGERLGWGQWLGVATALGGLVGLLWPGLSAPPPIAAVWMLSAGVAWGVYSLRGRGAGDPVRVTAGNFLRAVPLAIGLNLLLREQFAVTAIGAVCAMASGALASGLGYAIWYRVLPQLRASAAATVQLSVPLLAALGGVSFLGELPSVRLGCAALAILGGVTLVLTRARAAPHRSPAQHESG